MDLSVLRVTGLYFTYEDGTSALNGVNFSLREGERVALLGANGSGKTTFVLHLNGLLKGQGEIEIDGARLTGKLATEARTKIGIVFQDSDSQLFMPTVLEDVAFGPSNQGLTPSAAIKAAQEALEQVGIANLAQKSPFHLSAGEKKKAAIAGILAMRPRILILDEPTTFLDPPARRSLITLLRRLPQSKLLITHDISFAEAVATRAVFFEKGRIIAEGSVRDVAARFDWFDNPEPEIAGSSINEN